MPFVEVLVYGQRLTPQQKSDLFNKITEELKSVLGVPDRSVRIALHEGAAEDCFVAARHAADPERR